jgi:ferredoxin
MRYVNYDKCKGCLKCVDVCEHGAIEVVSIKEGKIKSFSINQDRCDLCKLCIRENFCFQNLFELKKENNREWIHFNKQNIASCFKCLKCFKSCPSNAIIPEID